MADCNLLSDDMKQCYENLIVIDAGANLTNKKYSRDLDSVIQRAKDAGKNNRPILKTSTHKKISFRFDLYFSINFYIRIFFRKKITFITSNQIKKKELFFGSE